MLTKILAVLLVYVIYAAGVNYVYQKTMCPRVKKGYRCKRGTGYRCECEKPDDDIF